MMQSPVACSRSAWKCTRCSRQISSVGWQTERWPRMPSASKHATSRSAVHGEARGSAALRAPNMRARTLVQRSSVGLQPPSTWLLCVKVMHHHARAVVGASAGGDAADCVTCGDAGSAASDCAGRGAREVASDGPGPAAGCVLPQAAIMSIAPMISTPRMARRLTLRTRAPIAWAGVYRKSPGRFELLVLRDLTRDLSARSRPREVRVDRPGARAPR